MTYEPSARAEMENYTTDMHQNRIINKYVVLTTDRVRF